MDFPGSNGRDLWAFLHDEAGSLSNAGIDAIWLPPASLAAFSRTNSVGYDVYDHFNLGQDFAQGRFPGFDRTKYGNKAELTDAVRSLHSHGLQVYADVVLNHKMGGAEDGYWMAIRVAKEKRDEDLGGEGWERGVIDIESYSKFEHAERGGNYSTFTWHARHFDSVDTAKTIKQNGSTFKDPKDRYIYRFLFNEPGYKPEKKELSRFVSLEKGNYDYLTGCDLDYDRYDVREEMKYWGEWMVKELDLDGVRLDAVKHIDKYYIREWLGHIRWKAGENLFAVAEYIEGRTERIHDYIKGVSAEGEFPQRVSMFDFPLRFKFGEASKAGSSYDLRNLNVGTIMNEQPALAVTFVENHDYEYGRDWNSHVEEWFKPLSYAFILLRADGFPCIFFPDYYGSYDWHDKAKDSDEIVLWHLGQKPGKEYLELFIKLRKQFALGEERYYSSADVAGWIRMGFTEAAKGAMAVAISNSYNSVKAIKMNTGRFNKRFYHLATVKWTPEGFIVSRGKYNLYGNKAEGLTTDNSGNSEFPVEGGSVSIWIEDGVGLV